MKPPKSYVAQEIARQRKILDDAISGKGLRDAIRALQEKSRVKDSLAAAPTRGALTSKHKVAKRTGSNATSDRTERSRAFYDTTRELRSSDGLFILQYHNVQRITFDTNIDRFLDYDPDNP